MNLVQRVQDILLKPRDTWQTIAQEPSDVPGLFKNYVVYLAAVSSLATFIGLSLVGVGGFGMSFRVPIVAGLVNLVVGFVLTLVMGFEDIPVQEQASQTPARADAAMPGQPAASL